MTDKINEMDDLNELIDDVDTTHEKNEENQTGSVELISAFVSALSGISKIGSEHTGIKSLALTPSDEKTLQNALAPMSKYLMQMLTFLPYLPLIVFAIGYTGRVMSEVSAKRKEKEERGEIPIKKKAFWDKR